MKRLFWIVLFLLVAISAALRTTTEDTTPGTVERVRGTGEIPGYPVWQDAAHLSPVDELR